MSKPDVRVLGAGRTLGDAFAEAAETSAFRLLLGAEHYEVRIRNGEITGAALLDVGRHVTPQELRALAERMGRRDSLYAAVADATGAPILRRLYGDSAGRQFLERLARHGSRGAKMALEGMG